jgi:hypothetical protein
MSGTSHDGISAAVVELDETKSPPVKLMNEKSATAI